MPTLFRELGYGVTAADTGVKAVAALHDRQFDCIVLDILLPDLDGYAICKAARTVTTAPIIFLTCLDELDDKLKGLMAGGDDYLTKPYKLEELAARVQALLRRSDMSAAPEKQTTGFSIDHENRIINTAGKNIFLTQKEFALFLLLYENPRQVFSREELLKAIWGEARRDDNTVAMHIMKLRRKLACGADVIGTIESDYGAGYHLEPPDTEEGP